MLVLSKYKVMKKTIYNLLTLFLLSMSITSCTDEDYSKNTGDELEEKTVKISLSLKSNTPQTKAIENILGTEDEEAIKSLQLFIFRRGGDQLLVKNYYFSHWNNKQIIDAYTGRFIYVLVANLHEEWTGVTKYSDITNKLYTIQTENDISRKDSDKSLAAVFNKELLIPYPPTGSDIVELKDGTDPISLKRLSSKVKLNLIIDGTTPDNKPLKNKLNIKSVQMKNASTAMYIFNENAPLDDITTDSVHYPIRMFDANNSEYKIDDAFYILERKAAEKLALGTYVEIKAEYRDTESNVPTKEVTYRAKFNTEPFANNNYQGLFNVSRNKLYMLNITLQGTNDDDIRVDIEELQHDGVYVNNMATGRGTGSTWEDAFTTINDAITFLNEYNSKNTPLSYVYVKEGTYNENIIVPNGVNIVGGFAHTLSGTDLTHNGTIKPVLRPATNNQSKKPIVTFPADLTTQTTLSYFRVEDGNAENGAGIYMQNKNAIVHACRIHNNKADKGGGVYITDGEIWNSIIDNNEASSNGAGIYIANNAINVRIQNATVVDNKWSHTPPPSPIGFAVNQPSSGIYAASGANGIAHSCILYGNDDTNNVPSGIAYKFCAFGTNQLLLWNQIITSNIGIYPQGTQTNQPYASTVYTPDFIDNDSYELNSTSQLISRSYVGRNQEDWKYPDFNGEQPINSKFPDLGAIQSKAEKEYLNVYVNEQTLLPFIYSTTDCFIASNMTKGLSFEAGELAWATQPEFSDFYIPMQLMSSLANTDKQDEIRIGNFMRGNTPILTIKLKQNYINFEQTSGTTTFSQNRNLYIMPNESQNTLLELFTHQPLQYHVSSSIDKDKREFKGIKYTDSEIKKWLNATENSDLIQFTNQEYMLSIDATTDTKRSFDQNKLEYIYRFDGTSKDKPLSPFNKTYKITQVPEWILGSATSRSILGVYESDYSEYFSKLDTRDLGKFYTWGFNAPILASSSIVDGKANTATVLNTLISSTNYIWDTSSEESYQATQNNAFIFCASLNPAVRNKLIAGNVAIDKSELTWYVPALNELKFISIFGNSSLQLRGDDYYITSTFANSKIRRINPTNFIEWNWTSGDIPHGYLRCIRNTTPSGSPYNGVTVVDSLGSYILRSEGMYSMDVVAQNGLDIAPSENQLAAKFQVYPQQNNDLLFYEDVDNYCMSLNTAGSNTRWRVPTRKELMLIYLLNDQLVANGTFEAIDTTKSYFIQQNKEEVFKKIFEFGDGKIMQYVNAKARVRCVRSIN